MNFSTLDPHAFTAAAIACVVAVCSVTYLASDARGDVLTAEQSLEQIENAHRHEVYEKQDAVQADFSVTFGESTFGGTMLFTPSMSKVRMQLDGGITIVYDGDTAWLSPEDAKVPGPPARFHVLTWPYFMAAAYKLDDSGTQHEYAKAEPVTAGFGKSQTGVKITFDSGVGDTPDDWYIAFVDRETNRLSALAYIVTYGKGQAKAEEQPGIILYEDFEEVDGVPFATTWKFHHWDRDTGVGDAKGSATLSNIEFVTPPDGAFDKPEGAAEATMPGS